tara:strand:- start:2344 stop:3462 length:1119 start_codon:yes stop_codon:yes gene_type:complete
MAWNDQGGGPWGQRPGKNGGGNGGQTPPDLEEILKKSQDNIKRFFPGGGKGGGKSQGGRGGFLAILGVVAALWMASGFYIVDEGSQGAVLRFGEWVKTTDPGIHYHLPVPVERVIITRVAEIRSIESGVAVRAAVALKSDNSDSLMLTGDENIVSVQFTVHWFIKDLPKFLFKVDNPGEAVRLAAESAVREIVAQTPIAEVLTSARGKISDDAQKLLQKMLDEYQAGIQIQRIQLKRSDPPAQVIDPFRDVQRARADKESMINEGRAYSNSIVPKARGEAARLIQNAEAYKKAVVDKALGEAARFKSVYAAYRLAPAVTKKRMKIDAMERVLSGTQKILLDGKAGASQGVLPYLPLSALKSKGNTVKEGDSK